MADKLIIKGLGGIDGEYEFDARSFLELDNPDTITQGEAHKIKQATGLRLGELEDAMEAGDADLVIAFAIVVLERAKKRYDVESLWAAPVGSLMYEPDPNAPPEPEAEEEDPLSVGGENEPTPQPDASGGTSGATPSESLNPSGRLPTGSQPSAIPNGDPDSPPNPSNS